MDGKSSVLNTVTREVCLQCDKALRKLAQAVEPIFLALACAAEDGISLQLAVNDARMLAGRAEMMAITNELTSELSRVATVANGSGAASRRPQFAAQSCALPASRGTGPFMQVSTPPIALHKPFTYPRSASRSGTSRSPLRT